jgi:glycosyltransferase involved in cell wall biosynthesis
MKIAVWHNLPSGGSCRALCYHLKGLAERGHEIELWANNPTIDGLLPLPDSIKIHQIELNFPKKAPSFSEKLGSFFFEKSKKMIALENHAQRCAEEINRGNFNVLFANTCKDFGTPHIARYVKTPSVLYLGEPYRTLYEALPNLIWEGLETTYDKLIRRSNWKTFFADLWNERAKRVHVREEKINYLAFNKVLVNSLYSNDTCIRIFGKAGEVCYLGIDTDIFKDLTLPKENFVIGLGNTFINKNPEFAILSVAEIQKNRPKIIWIANMGDINYTSYLIALAKDKKVDFEIKKSIPDTELVELLNKAICMVYTSQLEPFGFAPLEANACKTPVVAIPQGGVRETIQPNFNGLWANTHLEMAKAIQFLQENPALYEKMRENGYENVYQKWTIQSCTDRLENALIH